VISRFFRAYFWGILIASLAAWVYFGYVRASSREAILIEDRFKGIDSDIIGPGQARFIARRALPGRIELHHIILKPRYLDYSFERGLLQSAVLGLDDSFNIKTSLRLEYSLNPEGLVDLFGKLDQPDWKNLDNYLNLRLNAHFTGWMEQNYRGEGDLPVLQQKLTDYLRNQAVKEIGSFLSREGVDVTNIVIKQIYIPDNARYQQMLARGNEILTDKLARIRKIEMARAEQDAERLRDQAYLSRLEKVGDLLKKYPNLRDYLAIDRLSGNVQVMVVPSDRWYPTDSELRHLGRERGGRPEAPVPEAAPPARQNGRFEDRTPP